MKPLPHTCSQTQAYLGAQVPDVSNEAPPPPHTHTFTQTQAYLGAQVPDVAGIVLHSPLLSGIRVLSPGLKWWPAFADVYPNHLMAPKIEAPTLVMHVRGQRGGGEGQ